MAYSQAPLSAVWNLFSDRPLPVKFAAMVLALDEKPPRHLLVERRRFWEGEITKMVISGELVPVGWLPASVNRIRFYRDGIAGPTETWLCTFAPAYSKDHPVPVLALTGKAEEARRLIVQRCSFAKLIGTTGS